MRNAKSLIVDERRIYIANGDKILTNESLARKSTYPKFFVGVPEGRYAEDSCLSLSDKRAGWIAEGSENINGYRAVRVSTSGAKRKMTAWHALDVGCAQLQMRTEHESGVTVQKLTSLVAGEPDAKLFDAPATLQEVPPSRLYEPICANGGSCKSLPEAVQQRMDSKYQAAQVH
jgi:hypothetical protein